MKQLKFILLCVVISAFGVSCTKSVYDEKQALEAQQGLLQFKYDQEIKLELLRQSGATALETAKQNLQYSFAIRTALFNDSLSKANTNSLNTYNENKEKKRDITVQVLDLITNEPIIGAEVTIPSSVGTIIKVKTDSLGRAMFSPNVNIPNPASALATKDGYASGSVFATIGGSSTIGASATIRIWNLKNATNTLKGKVYIENDLTNDVPENAKNAFINCFTFVNVNGYNQRFDFTTTTNDNGEYSIKIPNLSGDLQFSHASLEGTSKMYVNSFVPGADSIPVVKSIAATYFLGDGGVLFSKGASYSTSNGAGYVQYPDYTLSGFYIPQNVQRYHVSATADSNGRGHFVKAISFSTSTLTTSATTDSAFLAGTFNYTTASVLSAANYSSNTLTRGNQYPSRYLAGTTVKDTVDATLYDVLANEDGYWKTTPVLKFELTTDSTTGNKYKYISKLIQKTGGKVIKPDVNFTHQTTLYNLIKTFSSTNSWEYDDRNVNSGFLSLPKELINNGKTYSYDLTFGAGKLKTAVR